MSETPLSSSPAAGEPAAASPIEFTCITCSATLRVPGGSAGRKVKCPKCDGINQIPLSEQPVAPPAAPQGDRPAAPSMHDGAPFGSNFTTPPAANPAPPISATPATQPPQMAAPAEAAGAVGTSAIPTGPSRSLSEGDGVPDQESPERLSEEMTPVKKLFDDVLEEVAKIYVGQDELVLGTLVALFSGGHVLIESVPGLGKTLFVRTLGKVLGCEFGRIQFTADLMPSDITGAPIFNMKTQEFVFRPGPVFTQFLLADEINRSPAKTHAALLEIMQEYHVTIDGVSHKIEQPFLVMATQNPIESEGTYNLPEAQLDRFMFKIVANYPSHQEETDILRMHARQDNLDDRLENEIKTITSPEGIMEITKKCDSVHVDEKLFDYVAKLVRLTREWPHFHMGASPRAGLALIQGARTLAAFCGRDYAVPDDIVQIALPALRHRVILTAEAEVEGQAVDTLLSDLIRSVEVPRL